jgi:hypothetical protein
MSAAPAFFNYVHTFTRELRMNAWRPICAARARMQGTDVRQQLRITACVA